MKRISWQLSLFPYEIMNYCSRVNRLMRGGRPFNIFFSSNEISSNAVFADTKTQDMFRA